MGAVRLEASTGGTIERGVEIRGAGPFALGAGSIIASGTLVHRGGLAWSQGQGEVRIGRDSYIGPHCVLFGAGGIRIGDKVGISPGVVLTSHEHGYRDPRVPIIDQPVRFAPIVIEDDVWIGSSAVVLPGITVHRGAVVGAGAVVTKDVAEGAVVVGVPAKPIVHRLTSAAEVQA